MLALQATGEVLSAQAVEIRLVKTRVSSSPRCLGYVLVCKFAPTFVQFACLWWQLLVPNRFHYRFISLITMLTQLDRSAFALASLYSIISTPRGLTSM